MIKTTCQLRAIGIEVEGCSLLHTRPVSDVDQSAERLQGRASRCLISRHQGRLPGNVLSDKPGKLGSVLRLIEESSYRRNENALTAHDQSLLAGDGDYLDDDVKRCLITPDHFKQLR